MMAGGEKALKEVDRIEILTLIDNYVDVLLGNTDVVTRPAHTGEDQILADTLVGEHGLSLLVTVYEGNKKNTVLFDTGYSAIGVPHNIEYLGLDLQEVEAIVLSHGHMDHLGSLYTLLDRMSKPMPVYVHPYAFSSPRYVTRKDGGKDRFPVILNREKIAKQGGKVVETESPTLIAGDTILVSGEVERTTSFERGMPNALAEKNGQLEKDPISDDQSLYVRLKDKGLVVIGGCSHAGIVNTVLYGRKVSGVQKVHAVLGGFHLGGTFYKGIIGETIDALKAMEPKVVVPMHCTGWNAVNQFAGAFPGAFVLSSVGSKLTLTAS
jgi:7,8-dihydropterin-6-yl-methyl-4-(beta-D-ribofuranosyl)aminobenzene 5'-phosphate synthase